MIPNFLYTGKTFPRFQANFGIQQSLQTIQHQFVVRVKVPFKICLKGFKPIRGDATKWNSHKIPFFEGINTQIVVKAKDYFPQSNSAGVHNNTNINEMFPSFQ